MKTYLQKCLNLHLTASILYRGGSLIECHPSVAATSVRILPSASPLTCCTYLRAKSKPWHENYISGGLVNELLGTNSTVYSPDISKKYLSKVLMIKHVEIFYRPYLILIVSYHLVIEKMHNWNNKQQITFTKSRFYFPSPALCLNWEAKLHNTHLWNKKMAVNSSGVDAIIFLEKQVKNWFSMILLVT